MRRTALTSLLIALCLAVTIPATAAAQTMRVLGDSVSAGFGYLGDGTPWRARDLLRCMPGPHDNNRCASNAANGVGSTSPLRFLPDFGLGNGVAWPAQAARSLGLTRAGQFANFAISGATPADFDTGGKFAHLTARAMRDAPDVVVVMLGANPILHEFILGRAYGCELRWRLASFAACADAHVQASGLTRHLASIVRTLVAGSRAQVVVVNYPLAVPASAFLQVDRVRYVAGSLQGAVRAAVRKSGAANDRILLMEGPQASTGLGPGTHRCETNALGAHPRVDGESTQARVTQMKLAILHPFGFCPGAVPWFISSETGAHLSVAGHAQYARAFGDLAAAHHLLGAGATPGGAPARPVPRVPVGSWP